MEPRRSWGHQRTSWSQRSIVTLWNYRDHCGVQILMEPRGLCDTARPHGTKECKGLKHSLQGSAWGKGNLLGGILGWHMHEECVCLGKVRSFRSTPKTQENPCLCLSALGQFSKQSRSQVREDRQDGVGECAARLSTLGQTSRHSCSEQPDLLRRDPGSTSMTECCNHLLSKETSKKIHPLK